MEASPETTAIPIHIHRIRDFFHALLSRPVVDEIASGRLEMKTAARYAAPTAPSLEDRESDHHRLRNTVQHRPEHDGQRRAALLISVGILAITSAEARNQPVAAEEHAAPDKRPQATAPWPDDFSAASSTRSNATALISTHRLEGHDQRDHTEAQVQPDRKQGADHQ
jgi:hypothetical protein